MSRASDKRQQDAELAPTTRPDRGRTWPLGLVIVAAGLLAFFNSFSGVFLFDDDYAIVENPYIRSLWPISQAMSAPPQASVSGRPIVSLSLAVNYALGGLKPWGYHAFNLAVHLLCGLLLFGIVRRTLEGPRLGERYGRSAVLLATLVGLLWVVHPVQTEAVTYIIQRTESMMGAFYLLTLYCVIRGAACGRRLWYIAAVVACALGMMTKESMVTAPVMVLLFDAVFTAGSPRLALRNRLVLYTGLAATWLILVYIMVGGPRSGTVGFSLGIRPIDYATNQCVAVIDYVRLAFWPHPLILDYGAPRPMPFGEVLPYAAILAVLLVATVIALFHRPMIGFLGAWFLVILAPTSSFVPITTEAAAERRMYLPLAAIIVLVVLAVHALGQVASARWSIPPRALRRVAVVAASGLACVLAYLTHQRNTAYADEMMIWQDALAARPNNPRAHLSLGKALGAAGRIDEAIGHYRKALDIVPDYLDARYNLANALQNKGLLTQAVDEYQTVLRVDPGYTRARINLGVALVRLKRFDEAVSNYQETLRTVEGPSAADIHCNLAVALLYAGHADQAITHFQQALALAPNDSDTRRNLAQVLMRQGRFNEAVQQFRALLRMNPNDAQAQTGLNEALSRLGNAGKP
jgi:tetratricopeptide (TPR) repeat protein